MMQSRHNLRNSIIFGLQGGQCSSIMEEVDVELLVRLMIASGLDKVDIEYAGCVISIDDEEPNEEQST